MKIVKLAKRKLKSLEIIFRYPKSKFTTFYEEKQPCIMIKHKNKLVKNAVVRR